VIFGVAANVSIGKLFMAGIVPGICWAWRCAITWWWVARKRERGPAAQGQPRPNVGALRQATVWALVLPVIIVLVA
jgi:TRAP-type C4-dicarboxylate transport system permease large subunit